MGAKPDGSLYCDRHYCLGGGGGEHDLLSSACCPVQSHPTLRIIPLPPLR